MDSNSSLFLTILMAFGLGLRHGLDLDHIATIDAITRVVRKRYLSKMAGLLFSLGHGIPVITLSLLFGSGLMHSFIPEWLDASGKWISLFFLFLFGALNLITLFQNPNHSHLPLSFRSFIAKKLMRTSGPLIIMSIGALFALSFDTFSQVALFSISASLVSGWLFSGILGLVFTLGMMAADGLNGFFVATLIERADRKSMILSRGLGLLISLFSFLIGFFGLLSLFA